MLKKKKSEKVENHHSVIHSMEMVDLSRHTVGSASFLLSSVAKTRKSRLILICGASNCSGTHIIITSASKYERLIVIILSIVYILKVAEPHISNSDHSHLADVVQCAFKCFIQLFQNHSFVLVFFLFFVYKLYFSLPFFSLPLEWTSNVRASPSEQRI